MGTDLQKSRLEAAIDVQRTEIERAAVKGWDVARQLDILATLAKNPKLQSCPPETVISSVVAIARRGLSLNPALGHAHLIPRKIRGSLVCTWQIGYQGYRHLLVEKAGMVRILAQIVRPGEEFSVDYYNEVITHRAVKAPGRAEDLLAAYAVGVFSDGSKIWRLLWRDEIEAIRDKALRRSEEGEFSPWKSDFPAMARKTAINALGRAVDLPEEAAEALRDGEDEAIEAEWREETPGKVYDLKPTEKPQEAPKAPEKAPAKKAKEPVKAPEKAPEKPAEKPQEKPQAPAEIPPPGDQDAWAAEAAEYLR